MIAIASLSQADLRSEITAFNKKVEKAAKAKDAKGAEDAYKNFVTSDFKYVPKGKPQTFKTFIGLFKASITMTDKVTSSSTRIISLKEGGNSASSELEKRMTGTMVMPPDKKIHTMDWTGHFTEEYRKVGGKWKVTTMTEGKQKFLVDGKPFKM